MDLKGASLPNTEVYVVNIEQLYFIVLVFFLVYLHITTVKLRKLTISSFLRLRTEPVAEFSLYTQS